MEVVTNASDEEIALKNIIKDNFTGTKTEMKKNKLKTLIGNSVVNLIHEIIGK